MSGNGVFTLSGGSLGRFGPGSNAITINSAPTCAPSCTLRTDIPNLVGVPVRVSETASVSAASGFQAFLGGSPAVRACGP